MSSSPRWSRSRTTAPTSSGPPAGGGSGSVPPRTDRGRLSATTTSPTACTTANRIALCSSRTFPGPDPLELLLLEEPQDFRLRGRGHVADFVEEDGAAARLLELADPLPVGPGERPLLVPEQLALQQRLGDGRAVDGEERLVGAL